MKNIKTFLFLSYILIFTSLHSQESNKWYNFYNTNNITCSLKDSASIWYGTYDGGVYKCDIEGNVLLTLNKNDGFPRNNISSIHKDKKGNIWIGIKYGGLIKYFNGEWILYNKKSQLPSLEINHISIDSKDNLWICSRAGITKYDGTKWKTYKPQGRFQNNYIWEARIDSKDIVYVRDLHQIFKFQENIWSIVYQEDDYKEPFPENNFCTIELDSNDNLWIGTWKYIIKYDGTNTTKYNNLNFPKKTYIRNIKFISDNEFIISTSDSISLFKDYTWHPYKDTTTKKRIETKKTSIPANVITYITQTQDKKTWIGTAHQGFCYFDGENFTSFKKQESDIVSVNNSISNIINIDEDSIGNLWIATQNGLIKRAKDSSTVYTKDNGLLDNRIVQVKVIKDKIWVVHPQGVSLLENGNWTAFSEYEGLVNIYLSGIYTDTNNDVYLKSYNGIWQYNDGKWNFSPVEKNYQMIGFNRKNQVVLKKKNKIYILNENKIKKVTRIKGYIPNGNHWDHTYCNIDPQKNLWFSTKKGLQKYNWETTEVIPYEGKTPLTHINTIYFDRDGNKWIGTWDGVTIYNENGITYKKEFLNNLSR